MRRLLMAGAIVFCGSAYASAQQVCQTEALKDPNLTLGEMYAKAEARAKAWKPDVVVANITNTAVGSLQESGKSATWNATFYSPSAKQQVLINVLNAAFAPSTNPTRSKGSWNSPRSASCSRARAGFSVWTR